MVERVGSREMRSRLADMLGRVRYGGEMFIVERSGKPMAAMIPVELFEQLIAEREIHFQILDRIRARTPDVPDATVIHDVAAALAAVRTADVESRP